MLNGETTHIDELLRGKQARTDEELEEQIQKVEKHLPGSEEQIDLERYDARQNQTPRTLSGLADKVKHAFGFTPQREFERRLGDLRDLQSVYDQAVESFSERLDDQESQLEQTADLYRHATNHFELLQDQYSRKVSRKERLEVEIGELEKEHAHGASSLVYEKRQQLNSARSEERKVFVATEKSMQTYVSSRDKYFALNEQVERMQEGVHEFQRQSSALGIHINGLETDQVVHFGGDFIALDKAYKKVGLAIERMNKFSKDVFGDGVSKGVDRMYAARIPGSPRDDELVDRWTLTRKQ